MRYELNPSGLGIPIFVSKGRYKECASCRARHQLPMMSPRLSPDASIQWTRGNQYLPVVSGCELTTFHDAKIATIVIFVPHHLGKAERASWLSEADVDFFTGGASASAGESSGEPEDPEMQKTVQVVFFYHAISTVVSEVQCYDFLAKTGNGSPCVSRSV